MEQLATVSVIEIQDLPAKDAEAMAERATHLIIDGVKKLNAKSDGSPLIEPDNMRPLLKSHFVQLLAARFALKP